MQNLLWRYNFSELCSSSDDGLTTLRLVFMKRVMIEPNCNKPTKQIEKTKEGNTQKLSPGKPTIGILSPSRSQVDFMLEVSASDSKPSQLSRIASATESQTPSAGQTSAEPAPQEQRKESGIAIIPKDFFEIPCDIISTCTLEEQAKKIQEEKASKNKMEKIGLSPWKLSQSDKTSGDSKKKTKKEKEGKAEKEKDKEKRKSKEEKSKFRNKLWKGKKSKKKVHKTETPPIDSEEALQQSIMNEEKATEEVRRLNAMLAHFAWQPYRQLGNSHCLMASRPGAFKFEVRVCTYYM